MGVKVSGGPSSCLWTLMTWDQVQRLKLESEGIPTEAIDNHLTRLHRQHTSMFEAGELARLPDWGKPRPWGVLLFQDDEPLRIVRYVIARSVSGLGDSSTSVFEHKAHEHVGTACIISKDAAVAIQDDNVSSIPVLLARFQRVAIKAKSCDLEPEKSLRQLYTQMSASLKNRVKYFRKLD